MDLAAAATKHYGNMTGRYYLPRQHAVCEAGARKEKQYLIKKNNKPLVFEMFIFFWRTDSVLYI